MKTIVPLIRIFLGLIIGLSGINKFTHWVDVAYMHDAMEFVMNLSNIGGGFIIYIIAVLELAICLALLTNRFSTLALLTLLPLIVSIIIFHVSLDIKGIAIALFVFALNVYLLVERKDRIKSIFAQID